MSGIEVITFGCRLNTYESEVMKAQAEKAGLNNAVLVNTCAVTGEAVRQARQAIRRVRRDNPHARIIVTGCAAQTEKETFAAMAEVDAVLGNEEKLSSGSYRSLPDFGVSAEEKLRVNDIMSVKATAPQMVRHIDGHVRAFIQVQNGCDHRCTFCIIPYGRGNSRSVPMGAVVDQARKLVDSGYREIVLTGVDATSYGGDLPGAPTLGFLAKTLLKQLPDIRRLRLSSIDSIEADAHLMDLIADESRFMPHLHLSLQHGDDMILKRMKRRHLRADALRFIEEARRLRPNMSFGADMIAGFPTETEEMFENAVRLAEEADIAHLHVFPYSPRPGTPAARMPQLDRSQVKERAARLRATGHRLHQAHLDGMIGSRQWLLVENSGLAHTENFTLAAAPGLRPGELVPATITGHNGKHLDMQLTAAEAA
ncbi:MULTISPECIES: tRNA (N(6)-L-threonylcarbamoyladenosine(37)-C(2))-methylthiotransferase MtaB [unclassified Rhizobium]|uniref:tRNA (N(6)-L-threonylcarbamoyladenosine(37)-C(2))- methylthiotransferase MtaB n=1 Tax=unclassified Rhizobium TaxID=2613769 RepID=UPI001C82A9CC|nr:MULTISPECIES: tRNA (N(6)-L-threonylcarbamoyladenosine(37)-C(2))-methylthiotransferase MtaB [unclassified Rhizobium]MBX5158301.1 tRNA (N(6)-L-threonylcarbamoyladenosine(37)-C(2))-methylthiotransferase MtaB [Rhizobium sp. NZLR8]MBX5163612.1 tRNA (N(6)-L-threonylcarbamoyladenosine(37)-C(2))-methylthiotransferase MtaB [Rhizobium sp. NZLR4b]MBX5169377.1 tRNA (N(6)-L-threonylcarbamoyladenosine(37)-C(2))-methylthiotransferase MtaB [Rhizobium sp. NZLR1b]MBX5182949.1 tRNA (N(6)-L-threonylcarbamoylade